MDDGMMTPDVEVDPLTLMMAKLEDITKRLDSISAENAQLKAQNTQLMNTNAKLLVQQPPAEGPVMDVRDVAFESFKKELLRGKI